MYRSLLFFFTLVFILPLNISGQDPVRLRSVHGSGGSSASFSADKEYYIIQSIGQGITGLSGNKSYLLRQGFVQPPVKANVGIGISRQLPATVTPNFKTGEIIIFFKEEMPASYYVDLTDLGGRMIYRKKHNTSPELRIIPGHLLPGVYFLRISARERFFISKMIWF